MKSIQDLAREAGFDNVNGKIYTWAGQHNVTDEMQRFHDAAIAQYRESLLAGVGGPHYWTQRIADDTVNMVPFYYPDQMAAAVLRATLAERERCAEICDEYAKNSSNPMNFAENCAAAIRGQI